MRTNGGNKRKAVKIISILGAAVLPFAVANSPASGTFGSASGTVHGLEHRDTTGGTGSCTDQVAPPLTFKNQATYRFPLSGTESVGFGTFENGSFTSRYEGPVEITWQANEVWDGPGGTGPSGHSACGSFGYPWPVTSASVAGGSGTDSVECNTLESSGSTYRRTASTSGGREVVVLKFSDCKIDGVSIGSNSVLTLQDRAHAGCFDLHALPSSGGGQGVSHCVSNYEIDFIPLP
jgi:hypothetical protein